MPSLSFKKQFEPRVVDGSKTHTIRAMRKRPFKAGDKLYLFVGLKTKYCRRLGNTECLLVEPIRITIRQENDRLQLFIVIGCAILHPNEIEHLAIRDGFPDGPAGMIRFWREENGLEIGQTWEGQIIHWRFPFDQAKP